MQEETRTRFANLLISERAPVNIALCDAAPHIWLVLVLDERTGIRQPVVLWISAAEHQRKKNGGAHRKDDDADGPAVDELIISLIIVRLIDDFWREVTWRPTHRLRTAHRKSSLTLHPGRGRTKGHHTP